MINGVNSGVASKALSQVVTLGFFFLGTKLQCIKVKLFTSVGICRRILREFLRVIYSGNKRVINNVPNGDTITKW